MDFNLFGDQYNEEQPISGYENSNRLFCLSPTRNKIWKCININITNFKWSKEIECFWVCTYNLIFFLKALVTRVYNMSGLIIYNSIDLNRCLTPISYAQVLLQPGLRSWDRKGAPLQRNELSNHQMCFTQVTCPE